MVALLLEDQARRAWTFAGLARGQAETAVERGGAVQRAGLKRGVVFPVPANLMEREKLEDSALKAADPIKGSGTSVRAADKPGSAWFNG